MVVIEKNWATPWTSWRRPINVHVWLPLSQIFYPSLKKKGEGMLTHSNSNGTTDQVLQLNRLRMDLERA
ncbi:MAG: hypothetical protein D3920_03290 [Candidatus Electrothrix sp. AW2]|nr:hypothetical protein [Candidatus Electrothrix gigas]MCI5196265.1 hypothetical protein [Candidatus Electrothrix gigas]